MQSFLAFRLADKTRGNLNGCLAATKGTMQAECHSGGVSVRLPSLGATGTGRSMPGLACLVAAVLVVVGQPSAQAPLSDSAGEIVVTGERVPRTLRETPSSVVVYTAPMIEAEAGADRLDQLLEQIPNIQVGAGTQGPTIRGQDTTGVLQDLPAFLGGTRPRVTVQVDGRAMSYNEFVSGVAPLWDVERIEVFRSPQSTTQGRNSIAGAIFVYTNDPAYDWEARARLIHGNLGTWQASAAVSGPIVDGQLAFRLSADARTSRNPNKVEDTLVVGANPNRDRYVTLRAKLLAEPLAIPNLRFEASYVHQDSRQAPGESIVPPFRDRQGSRGAAVVDTNVDSLTAEARYDMADSLRLTATVSGGWIDNQRFAIQGLGETRMEVRDRSVEALLDWEPSDRVSARIGLHRHQTKLDQFIDLTRVFGIGEFDDRQHSLGLFGEVELRPAPRLKLIAGLRRQRDRQDREGSLGNPFFPTEVDFDRSFAAWLPKLSFSYDVSDAFTAGLLVQRAYNPGGVTINFDTGEQQEFDRETLWSYELFGRATLLDGRLWLSANLFRSEFRGAQRAEQHGFTIPGQGTAFWFLIYNVPEARSQGLEASADWRATGRLRLRGGVGILRTRIGGGAPAAFAGKQFGRAPRFSGTLSAEWRPFDRWQINADVRHHSGYFSNDLNTPGLKVGGATVVNARAAYEHKSLTLFAYARNLLDNFYLTSRFSQSSATTGDPREIGVGLEARF
ncbi:MAG TPA: TonB-dependent receptor [Sphingomicrobium sp.]|nr:TonB-dependent receptor [Sphingomicrobium sp.]